MREGSERRRVAGRNLALYNYYKEWLREQEEDATSCGALDYARPVVQADAELTATESKAERLLRTRRSYRAMMVESIEMAKNVFDDYVDSNKRYSAREKDIIKRAVWMSAMNPYANPYESFNRRTMPLSRAAFHRHKKKLLDNIADMAGI